jgi:MFS family permease
VLTRKEKRRRHIKEYPADHCTAVAPNSNALIVGRAITGLGAAGVIAGCYTIAAFAVPPEKRPAFTGALAGTYGIGSSIAPVIGGVLADRVTWRWWFVFCFSRSARHEQPVDVRAVSTSIYPLAASRLRSLSSSFRRQLSLAMLMTAMLRGWKS